jgi:hypothetical protein
MEALKTIKTNSRDWAKVLDMAMETEVALGGEMGPDL